MNLSLLETLGEPGADCVTSLRLDDGANWLVSSIAFYQGVVGRRKSWCVSMAH